jgi:hypothetical protein
MLFLYLSLLLLLALVRVLFHFRARRLEKKFVRTAAAADELIRTTGTRGGTSNRADPYVAAKHQYELARVALKRDAVEARYARWQARSERLGHWLTRLRGWKGRFLPYALGALDVAGVLVVVEHLGAGPVLRTWLAL